MSGLLSFVDMGYLLLPVMGGGIDGFPLLLTEDFVLNDT